ncbi:50S ribosomal protein L1 [Candidatus Pantoea edessiphila]|uniref:Large ribosomal subunit protein uL1 n=1 Tax=Candidatus Pantoea edessiphila TaxID=2044610 RepID=A0A2P5SYB2_9GAMM|nr:50S ribosomal protein L1 [Candidatus Pantoea edessiphila]MBK4775548.1 50S ribosomal protein L1 [Pantoea sp. Edef]PPI87329.1 50S ribosomal protein L1 [Candidatus Pantoea edessiphila]
MIKTTKRMHVVRNQLDLNKKYDCIEAITILKKFAAVNFIESIDVAINLGVDAKKPEQNVRGSTNLPNSTGRSLRIAVFAEGLKAEEAKKEGAVLVGMQDLADTIKQGNINFDVVIADSDSMHIVSKLGQILGSRGLMPNPKMGTVTTNIVEAVRNAKLGQIRFRNDKNGIIHASLGKVNLEIKKLKENLEHLIIALKKIKPVQAKGNYIKKISISTTMGIGINIDLASLNI